jgi:hypothetical protein
MQHGDCLVALRVYGHIVPIRKYTSKQAWVRCSISIRPSTACRLALAGAQFRSGCVAKDGEMVADGVLSVSAGAGCTQTCDCALGVL